MSDNRIWLVHVPSGKKYFLGGRAGLYWGESEEKSINDFLNETSEYCQENLMPENSNWQPWDNFALENENEEIK